MQVSLSSIFIVMYAAPPFFSSLSSCESQERVYVEVVRLVPSFFFSDVGVPSVNPFLGLLEFRFYTCQY